MSATRPEVGQLDEEERDEQEMTALTTIPSDALVDAQISTAKRFPRSLSRFRREAEEMATLDQEAAEECLYAMNRGGKVIEGPSVRLAEILLYAWGNARAAAEVIEEGQTHLTAQGTFFDLERNVAVQKKVKRRITDKAGRRFGDDLIGVTGNAAISIAFRNAVFAGVPKALWKGTYAKARLASLGKGGTLTQARQKMLDHFGKLGVQPAKVYALLNVGGLEDVGEDQLVTMRGLANAIRDGETTVEEVFSPRAVPGAEPTPDLNARVKAKDAKPADDETAERTLDAKFAK